MKKMIPVMMLSGIIGLSACGNKTEQPQQNADTLEVADTIKEDTAAVDTPQTAEVQENAQEEKTVEKNVKSTQAGGTTISVGEPLAETLRKAKGVTFEYNADYGVACNIGKVYISIPDEDITKAGLDYVNSLTSDIEPNIDFKLEYIKPSAKIKDFEIN